jgi:hypothetical protein
VLLHDLLHINHYLPRSIDSCDVSRRARTCKFDAAAGSRSTPASYRLASQFSTLAGSKPKKRSLLRWCYMFCIGIQVAQRHPPNLCCPPFFRLKCHNWRCFDSASIITFQVIECPCPCPTVLVQFDDVLLVHPLLQRHWTSISIDCLNSRHSVSETLCLRRLILVTHETNGTAQVSNSLSGKRALSVLRRHGFAYQFAYNA